CCSVGRKAKFVEGQETLAGLPAVGRQALAIILGNHSASGVHHVNECAVGVAARRRDAQGEPQPNLLARSRGQARIADTDAVQPYRVTEIAIEAALCSLEIADL